MSLPTFRSVVVVTSALFCLLFGLSLFLVYQDAAFMHNQINNYFSGQQLLLARQAAWHIGTQVRDIEVEIESFKRLYAPDMSRRMVIELMRAILGRTRAKGLMEIGLSEQDGSIVGVHDIDVGILSDTAILETDCAWDESGGMVLGPLKLLSDDPEHPRVASMLCRKIGLEGDRTQILFARIDVSRLVGNATRPIRSGKTGYAWVVDTTGRFLFHPEEELIGQDAFAGQTERSPYLTSAHVNKIMKEQMLRGEEGTGTCVSGWHKGLKDESTTLIAFTPVHSSALASDNVWSVAVVAPRSEVAETVRWTYLRHFAAEGIFIIGMCTCVLLGAIYQQRVVRTVKGQVKRIETQAAITEHLYRSALEHVPAAVYLMDLDMHVVCLNRSSIDTFSGLAVTGEQGGVSVSDADPTRPEQFLGRKIEELIGASEAALMRNHIVHVCTSNERLCYEHTVVVKGRQALLSTTLIPIRDEEGNVRHILGISREMAGKEEKEQ